MLLAAAAAALGARGAGRPSGGMCQPKARPPRAAGSGPGAGMSRWASRRDAGGGRRPVVERPAPTRGIGSGRAGASRGRWRGARTGGRCQAPAGAGGPWSAVPRHTALGPAAARRARGGGACSGQLPGWEPSVGGATRSAGSLGRLRRTALGSWRVNSPLEGAWPLGVRARATPWGIRQRGPGVRAPGSHGDALPA